MREIILASSSPRRSELLKQIGLVFKTIPSDIKEEMDTSLDVGECVANISFEKARHVAEQLARDVLVIGADTVVVKEGILGKPRDEKEAYEMLKSLEGGWHEVITGITVMEGLTLKAAKAFEKTRVKMRNLSDEIIKSYIRTGEPMDKAGAYGIQGLGAVLVERIEGCYFNVVGLPLMRLSKMLAEFGVHVL
ncbi:MAG: Maf family protein [Clostridiales bacterium]|jgi:septum formation protein|nr:Maf family protein [Eubacteriales bacterium]MDH7566405.1 Maf family protein [Clostridiales bacterium]